MTEEPEERDGEGTSSGFRDRGGRATASERAQNRAERARYEGIGGPSGQSALCRVQRSEWRALSGSGRRFGAGVRWRPSGA